MGERGRFCFIINQNRGLTRLRREVRGMMRNDEIVEEKLGENPAGLKLKYKEKAGTFSGSFKAYIDKKGKPKGVTVSVSGVMIDGKGYGMATIKKAGSVAVTIE